MALSHTVGLELDRLFVDDYLTKLLCSEEATGIGIVQEAMRYAVLGTAQRIRPILSLRVARLLDAPEDETLCAAAAVELLHCASLIVDDLPCMDDASFRRNRAAVHIRYGEATAVLAAFGLVALAARSLVENSFVERYRRCLLEFQISLLRTLDCSGLIAGQAMDLNLSNSDTLIPASDISELKTVPLFTLAVSAGSLFVDLDPNEQALLSCFGREFGLAFQLSDDLLDGELGDSEPLEEKLTTLRAAIAPFGESSRDLEELVDYLHARVSPQRS
jgi:geranylgeranyl diphosphate synthase type II